jgi:hypothetical protein
MKMLVKLSIVATLFFVALLTSNETKAQANPVSQQQSGRQTFISSLISSTMDLINQKIKLTEKQQAELKVLFKNQFEELNEFWKKNKDKREVMQEYRQKLQEKYEAQIKTVLTEEQYKIYKEYWGQNAGVKFDSQQNKMVIDLSKLPKSSAGGFLAYDNGRKMKLRDSIQLGKEVTFVIYWTEQGPYSSIVFTDPIKYELTAEEIKNKQYSFTVKPERTTTYTCIYYYKDNRTTKTQRVIKVIDKNGKEIK